MPNSIQDDLQSLISGFANKSINQPADGIDAALLVPATAGVVADPNTVQATIPAPVETVPADLVVAPVVTEVVKVNPDAAVENWDGTQSAPPKIEPTTTPVASPVDYSKVANVLGKEKITTEDELVNEVKSVKQQLESYKALPETLVKAVELAKQGGNYLEYLGVSQVDWSKEDPITLYENHVEDQFTNSDGTVDLDKVDKLLDALTDEEKELRGRDLQHRYVNYQIQLKTNLEAQARSERANFEASLRSTVNQLNEVGSFKLNQNHKEELFGDILSGKDLQFGNLQQRAIAYFIRKNWDKIDSFRRQQIKNAATREVLDEAQIPAIRPAAESAAVPSTKGYGLDDFLKEIEQNRSRF